MAGSACIADLLMWQGWLCASSLLGMDGVAWMGALTSHVVDCDVVHEDALELRTGEQTGRSVR